MKENPHAIEHYLKLVANEAINDAVRCITVEPTDLESLLHNALSNLEAILQYSTLERSVYLKEAISDLLRAGVILRRNKV